MKYKGFISYSHAADGKLAPALQRAVQRIGKRWFRRPVIKLFRDQASLSASPQLWPEIVRNLTACEYFIYLASSEAAQSSWVRREIQWWLEQRTIDRLLIVVTGGELVWDESRNDFDWKRTTCLPSVLTGRFQGEPLHVDLRWARSESELSLRHSKFRDAILTLAARLHGRSKDELDSEEIREHRRFRIASVGTVVVLNVLALAAAYFFWTARQESARAITNWRESESRRLSMWAINKIENEKSVDDAIKIAIMAWQLAPTDEAGAALERIDRASSSLARILGQHTEGITVLAFSRDGRLMATIGREGSILLWNTASWTLAGPPMASSLRPADTLRFAGDASQLLARSENNTPELWEISSGSRHDLKACQFSELKTFALSDDGSLIAGGGPVGLLRVCGWRTGKLFRATLPPTIGIPWNGANLSEGGIETVRFQSDQRLQFTQLWGGRYLRTGTWELESGQVTLGPHIEEPFATSMGTSMGVAFNASGTRIRIYGHGQSFYDIGPKLQLLATAGNSDEFKSADDPRFGPVFSPDGKWRAEYQNEKILVWRIGAHSSGPSKTIETHCNFSNTRADCVRQLCEKIAPSLKESDLRDLFGIQNYTVNYEYMKSIIRSSLCEFRK
ncbi:MAG: TIR domain-containing protein [Candidatus Solibacter sp.]